MRAIELSKSGRTLKTPVFICFYVNSVFHGNWPHVGDQAVPRGRRASGFQPCCVSPPVALCCRLLGAQRTPLRMSGLKDCMALPGPQSCKSGLQTDVAAASLLQGGSRWTVGQGCCSGSPAPCCPSPCPAGLIHGSSGSRRKLPLPWRITGELGSQHFLRKLFLCQGRAAD